MPRPGPHQWAPYPARGGPGTGDYRGQVGRTQRWRPQPSVATWMILVDGHPHFWASIFVGGTSHGWNVALPQRMSQGTPVGTPSRTGIPRSCSRVTPATNCGSFAQFVGCQNFTDRPTGMANIAARESAARKPQRLGNDDLRR